MFYLYNKCVGKSMPLSDPKTNSQSINTHTYILYIAICSICLCSAIKSFALKNK